MAPGDKAGGVASISSPIRGLAGRSLTAERLSPSPFSSPKWATRPSSPRPSPRH